MRKIYLLTGTALLSAVLLFTQCKNEKPSDACGGPAMTESYKDIHLPIAVVNVDTLLDKYLYAVDLSETLLRKQESSRATLTQKARELRNEMEEFQRKLNNNAFLSQDRAQQENDRLMRKQQDLQLLDERMTNEFLTEQQKLNQLLKDSVDSSIAMFNSDRRFQLILSNASGDNVLYYDKSYDITQELIDFMNARYCPTTPLVVPGK